MKKRRFQDAGKSFAHIIGRFRRPDPRSGQNAEKPALNPGHADQVHQHGKGCERMKTFSLPFLFLCLLFAAGCSGFSRLPKINFIGKSREEVIRIFAQNPEKARGTHINICTPLNEKPPYDCGNKWFFTTLEEVPAAEHLKKAPALRGYETRRRFAVPAAVCVFKEVSRRSA